MASMMEAGPAGGVTHPSTYLTAGMMPFSLGLDRNGEHSLATLIEGEIIPRLVVAHAVDRHCQEAGRVPAPITDADVETLAALALEVEADGLLGHVEAIIARGSPVDAVLVDLMAPAARLLGEYWKADTHDFLEVTMALWRLQEAVHELAARMPPERAAPAGSHRALFATMPGDQHSFGTVVIDELFRREGWLTDRISEADSHELLRRVAQEWFDMVGLTVSCDSHIPSLPSIIVALRNVSRNPRVCVMVGGRIFSADPDLAVEVGADGTARDARLALDLASRLVRGREQEALARI